MDYTKDDLLHAQAMIESIMRDIAIDKNFDPYERHLLTIICKLAGNKIQELTDGR